MLGYGSIWMENPWIVLKWTGQKGYGLFCSQNYIHSLTSLSQAFCAFFYILFFRTSL